METLKYIYILFCIAVRPSSLKIWLVGFLEWWWKLNSQTHQAVYVTGHWKQADSETWLGLEAEVRGLSEQAEAAPLLEWEEWPFLLEDSIVTIYEAVALQGGTYSPQDPSSLSIISYSGPKLKSDLSMLQQNKWRFWPEKKSLHFKINSGVW